MKKTILFLALLLFTVTMSAQAQYFQFLKSQKVTTKRIIVTDSLNAPFAHIVKISVDTLVINADTIINVNVLTVRGSNTGAATDTVLTVVTSMTSPKATITYLNSTKDTITTLITTESRSSVSLVADSLKVGSIWFKAQYIKPYSDYTALLTTADDTLPPTATVLNNNLATIVWTKTDTGTYVGTASSSLLTAAKTYIPYCIWTSATEFVYAYRTADNTVTVVHKTFAGARKDGLVNVPFEVRKYLY